MEVILDGRTGNAFPEMPDELLAAIGMITETLHEQGRAVLSLELDGESIPLQNIVECIQGKSVGDFHSLSIKSEDTLQLVEDTLREMEGALPELPQACHRLAEIFQGESPESGYEPFHQLADIWSTIKERELQMASALNLELDALEIKGKPLSQWHREFNSFIEEAAQALESGDTVLLGDLLEYELAPRAETEAEIATLFRTQVSARR